MKFHFPLFLLVILITISSCRVTGKLNPDQKTDRSRLDQDFTLLRGLLEQIHPSLYWYTGKDSMDDYFSHYRSQIKDSMTEEQFQWKVLSPLLNKIHCGHTSVMASKAMVKHKRKLKEPVFPFYLKVWNDTMAIIENMNRQDSVFTRGTIIRSVDGHNASELTGEFLDHLSEDGYAHNVNLIRMSANFPALYRVLYGQQDSFRIAYLKPSGILADTTIAAFVPGKKQDTTTVKRKPEPAVTLPKKPAKAEKYRSFTLDSTGLFAVMRLNSFTKGRLRPFFRKSFSLLRKKQINHLVLDIRTNGGGMVSKSILLTKYLSRKPFRVADSVYAIKQHLRPFTRYFKGKQLVNLALGVMTVKKKDGRYHLTKYEIKSYRPFVRNHFSGNVHVLVNGPTFSASCLLLNTLKGQDKVTIIGEETGGGWYGNSGIQIPVVTLPYSGLRVRVPLFRVVNAHHLEEHKGKGIAPDILVPTSYDAILKGYDKKMEFVSDLIRKTKQ